MPFADKVVHVTISGAMMGGAEEWQTGFYVGQSEGAAGAPVQAYADAVRDAWTTFFEDTLMGFSNWYSFTQVKVARLGTDGKYDGSEVVVSTPAAPVYGTKGGAPFPPQIALVATLIGGSGKGLGGKGRMYLPGITQALESNGYIATSYAQTVANKLSDFLDTINASFDNPGYVINASKGHAKLAGIGARNVPVNGVRVGNVYDTQRRRRNGFSESYSHADLGSN